MIFALAEVQVTSNAIHTYGSANSLRQLTMLFALTYVQTRMNLFSLMKVLIIVNDFCTSVLTQSHGSQGQKPY